LRDLAQKGLFTRGIYLQGGNFLRGRLRGLGEFWANPLKGKIQILVGFGWVIYKSLFCGNGFSLSKIS